MLQDEVQRAALAKKGSPYLNTDQAGHYIGLTGRALEKMRRQGRGPRYRKHGGAVRYHITDLDAWSNAHVMRSTHDPAPIDPKPFAGMVDHDD